MDGGGLSPRTKSLEEGNQARPDLQSTTARGRLGQTSLLQHDLHGAECSIEEAHGPRTVWTSPSINLPNLQLGCSSSPYGQLPDFSCFDPIEVVVELPNVKTNLSIFLKSLSSAKKEELFQPSNEPNHNELMM